MVVTEGRTVDILWADVLLQSKNHTLRRKQQPQVPGSANRSHHGAKAPHPSTAAGDVAHQRLKQQIARRHVRLVVEESDPQGNLICYVRLAQRKAAKKP